MSRIGKLPISIPAGVTITQGQDSVVTVKGPKGELSQKVDPSMVCIVRLSTTWLLVLARVIRRRWSW